jgi:Amt family ammonium transporter
MLVFIAYQMMFAIITPALITGAFSNRVRFGAYLIFVTSCGCCSSTSRSST